MGDLVTELILRMRPSSAPEREVRLQASRRRLRTTPCHPLLTFPW